MSAIGPGDWVECVGNWPGVGLSLGSIWLCDGVETVDGECARCRGDADQVLVLRGYRPRKGCLGLCPCGFRPIYRPKAETFTHLLESVKDGVLVDA